MASVSEFVVRRAAALYLLPGATWKSVAKILADEGCKVAVITLKRHASALVQPEKGKARCPFCKVEHPSRGIRTLCSNCAGVYTLPQHCRGRRYAGT